jgi:hypothetical protein
VSAPAFYSWLRYLIELRVYWFVCGTPRHCVPPLLAAYFFVYSNKKVSKKMPPQSHSRPKRRPVPSSGAIGGAAEKLASKKRSLRQFQRKTPRRSHPPRLRQWGRLRASRVYNIVATQLVMCELKNLGIDNCATMLELETVFYLPIISNQPIRIS